MEAPRATEGTGSPWQVPVEGQAPNAGPQESQPDAWGLSSAKEKPTSWALSQDQE